MTEIIRVPVLYYRTNIVISRHIEIVLSEIIHTRKITLPINKPAFNMKASLLFLILIFLSPYTTAHDEHDMWGRSIHHTHESNGIDMMNKGFENFNRALNAPRRRAEEERQRRYVFEQSALQRQHELEIEMKRYDEAKRQRQHELELERIRSQPNRTVSSQINDPTNMELTSADLMFVRGESYFDQMDWVNATYWFQKAAEKGHPKSQLTLGMMYYQGGYGIEQNYNEAKIWYGLACDNEFQDGCDGYALSNIKANGYTTFNLP